MDSAGNFGNWLLDNAINVAVAIAILIAAYWIGGIVRRWIARIGQSYESLDDTLFGFLGSLAFYVILVFAGIMVLERFGITTTSLVAIIGAAGLAVGLALQGTLSNLAAGVMILLFRPFRTGDFVDAGGVFGQVADITLFTTDIGTFDNQHIIVPNSKIWGDTITNHSHHPVRGVDMVVGVAYDSDLDKVEASIRQVLADHQHILDDHEPFVAVETLNDSSIDFLVRPFCKGEHFFDVRYSVPKLIAQQFARDGIEIPFPQRVVHMAK